MWPFLTEQFHKGGPVMWPLLAAGFLSVVFVLERLWVYVRVPGGKKAEERLREAEQMVQEQGVEEAARQFVRRWGLFRYVFLAVLGRYEGWRTEQRRKEDPEAELVRIADEAAQEYLGRFLTVLSTIGSVAPLLGLLGTILGMIRAFSAIARAGVGDPTVVASGISEALITTATGLMIAIPTIVLHRYLAVKAGRILRKVEGYTHAFVYTLLENTRVGEEERGASDT